MKQSFYTIFYSKTHNETISCFLADFAYLLLCLVFAFKKLFRKKELVAMTKEKAKSLINNIYPKPESVPEYINPVINQNMDLSIVVPVYNYADILDKTIQSILNQKTRYNFEVIFVDDGSTDGAKDVLNKYKKTKNVKIIFQENGGIGSARNTGINNATGKYLMFVDCDDLVHDDIVESLLTRAYANNLDMVIAGHNLVKEKNGEVVEIRPYTYPHRNLLGFKNGDEIMNYPGLPWAKIYKRELWNNVRFFPGYWYEDTIIQFLIFTQVKTYDYVPKVVYDYKWYEKNFSHTQNNKNQIRTIERYWIIIEIIKRYNELSLPIDAQFYTLLITHFSAYYYSSISGHKQETIDALFVLAKQEIDKYKIEDIKLPYVMKNVEKAFDTRDKALWKLASSYQ